MHIPSAIAQEQNTGNPFLDNPDIEKSWGDKFDEDNEVVMYERDNEERVVRNAKYKKFRGVVKINTTLNSIIRLLEDPAAGTAWIYQCDGGRRVSEDDVNEESKKERIRQFARNESIKHFTTNGFWSYNFDSVVRNTRIPDVARKVVTISIDCEHDFIPEDNGLFSYKRIRRVYGKWELSLISGNRAEVIYELYSEPPIEISPERVNKGMRNNMFETLKGMKEVLECRRDNKCKHRFDC